MKKLIILLFSLTLSACKALATGECGRVCADNLNSCVEIMHTKQNKEVAKKEPFRRNELYNVCIHSCMEL